MYLQKVCHLVIYYNLNVPERSIGAYESLPWLTLTGF